MSTLFSVSSTHTTTGSLCAGILLEHYRYPPGPPGADDMHTHDDYQLGLCLDFPGEYVLRSGSIAVPVGALSIIHPGELHAARDPIERRTPATFRMFYLPLDLVQRVSAELSSHPPAFPFFATPVIDDRHIIDRFLTLDAALAQPGALLAARGALLAQEDALLAALTALFIRYADTRHTLPDIPDALPVLKRVRDYLHAHAAENVSLATLATLADLSPFQLCRAFRTTYGMPPHHYLIRARIDNARRLLAAGLPPAHVAAAVGFADQSHFGRHFKRLIGVTPGAYTPRARTFYTA